MEVLMTESHDRDPSAELPIAEPLRPPGAGTAPMADPAPAPTLAPVASSGDGVAFSTRNAGPGKLRAGVVAGAAVALAVGAVATSLAASPTPTTPAPTVTTGQGTSQVGGGPLTIAAPGVGLGDPSDFGRKGDHGFRDITIASISGSDVTLKTDDGWSRTVTVTDSVALTKGGQTIALADLAVGDQVRLEQTRNADGTYTVTGLAIVVPSVRGTVSDVTSSGFKVTTRDGSVWTITVDGSTVYQFGRADGSLSDVSPGAIVGVQGESAGDNALKALSVRVAPDAAMGTVKSKTADTIVVTKRDGSTVTVHVDGSTTYRVAGVDTAGLGDITVGMVIGVAGRDRSDGSIDADTVAAGDGHGFRGFGDGPGFGHDGGPDDDDGAAPSASPSATP